MQTYENVANRIDRFASRCRNRDQSIFSGGGGDASFPSSAISSGVTDGCSRGELRAYQAHKTMMMTAGNAGQNSACCQPSVLMRYTTTAGAAGVRTVARKATDPINVNILRAPRRCQITPPGNWKAA